MEIINNNEKQRKTINSNLNRFDVLLGVQNIPDYSFQAFFLPLSFKEKFKYQYYPLIKNIIGGAFFISAVSAWIIINFYLILRYLAPILTNSLP